MQIAANDPFFNPRSFRTDLVKQSLNEEEHPGPKAASWVVVGQMMCRKGTDIEYTTNALSKTAIASGLRKLHTLAEQSVNLLHRFVRTDPISPEADNFQNETLLQAGSFIIKKIHALDSGARSTAGGNSKSGNGFMHLQKRLWELLLAVLTAQQSKFRSQLETWRDTFVLEEITPTELARMGEYNRGRSLFSNGAQGDISEVEAKKWGKDRLSAFGSMAIWFLYGAAGWWHCMTDPYHFNQKDVWSLMVLAHEKHRYLYPGGHAKKRHPERTPWYTLDSFIRWLLSRAHVGERDVTKIDWSFALKFWRQHITEENLTRFVLQDLMQQLRQPTPLASLGFDGHPAPQVIVQELCPNETENCRSRLLLAFFGFENEPRAVQATEHSSSSEDGSSSSSQSSGPDSQDNDAEDNASEASDPDSDAEAPSARMTGPAPTAPAASRRAPVPTDNSSNTPSPTSHRTSHARPQPTTPTQSSALAPQSRQSGIKGPAPNHGNKAGWSTTALSGSQHAGPRSGVSQGASHESARSSGFPRDQLPYVSFPTGHPANQASTSPSSSRVLVPPTSQQSFPTPHLGPGLLAQVRSPQDNENHSLEASQEDGQEDVEDGSASEERDDSDEGSESIDPHRSESETQ